ncbi:MAG TPA: serine/threonine-protein kinase [Gemmatimonadales bacterium]|nr:serine/threonine-protein kinase [Gemmatimonadales bacterium]
MDSPLQAIKNGLAGRYEVDRQIGEGGMAMVFLATDLKHDRQVAVKVLRPEVSAVVGADRFLREIRVTAQLQHPHILPLFDSGASDGYLYYVMPLVQGGSLRNRLEREGPLPVEETVSMVRALAGALDYAHRHGVLHRDLKPENILLHDGQPMLADFGIALAVAGAGGPQRLTGTGISMGTPSYMSPEQVSGDRHLDARSDIYALACVAYELLTGEPPFVGPTAQAVLAAVLTGAPPPLEERRATAPPALVAAIHRGLQRLPADRFATAAEFAAALTTGPQTVIALAPRRASRLKWLVPVAAGAGLLAGIGLALLIAPSARAPVGRWNIPLPLPVPLALEGSGVSAGQVGIALAPVGARLAYVAARGSTTVLAAKALDGDSVVTFAGTEGAAYPFFSPDGEWIAFIAGGLLRKVSAAGGNPITLGTVDRVTGAAWPTPDRILLIENGGFNLRTLSASGATADSTIHLTTQFGTPDVLPGGKWAVGELSSGQLALLSISDGTEFAITRRGVLPMDSVGQADLLFGASPRYLPSGFLVYGTGDGVLAAMPFDASSRRVKGESVPIVTGVRMEGGFGCTEFAVSDDGTLVYVPGGNQLYVHIAFAGPNGRFDTIPVPRGPYTQTRISPDGTKLAVQMRNPVGGWQVMIFDMSNGVRQTVPVAGNYRAFPSSWLSNRDLMIGIWDPVQFLNYGLRLQSLETGKWSDLRLRGASYLTPAPDGKSFVFSDWRSGNLFLQSLSDQDTARTPIPAKGFAASFSPDGRWLVWGAIDGSVAASPVPPTGAVYPVAERGQFPLWTPRGDAVIYRDGSRFYRSPISTVGGFRAGRAEVLTEGPFLGSFAWTDAISPSGRLLVLLSSPERETRTLGAITGFPEIVRRNTPSKTP